MRSNLPQVVRDLQEVYDLLKREGWRTGSMGSPGLSKCLHGAFKAVTGSNTSSEEPRVLAMVEALKPVIKAGYWDKNDGLAFWNDQALESEVFKGIEDALSLALDGYEV